MMNSIKKNFIYNSLYQILLIIIPLITAPYLSRNLGADGIGIFAYYYSIANYFVLFIMLGVNNYGNREIARAGQEKEELAHTFWSIYALQFSLGCLCSVLYIFYGLFISSDSQYALIMALYVLSGALDINWCFFGMEKFKFITLRNIFIKLTTTVMILLLVKNKEDVGMYCLITAGGALVSQIAVWPYLLKNIGIYKPKIKEVLVHVKPNLYLFLTVLAVSIYKIMDKIMLGTMTNTTQVGFYESSEKVIAIPTALITSLGTVMLPRMTSMVKNNDDQSSETIRKSLILAMLMSSSMSFGIMGIAKTFVPFFYGEGYDACVDLFVILLPSCLFLSFANVIRTQYLLPHNMDKNYIISAFLGAGINFTINIILIPKLGAKGAAIGTLCAEALVCSYQCFSVRKYLRIKKYIIDSVPIIISGITMFLLLFNLNLNFKSKLLELAFLIVLGIVVYVTQIVIVFFIKKCIDKRKKERKI